MVFTTVPSVLFHKPMPSLPLAPVTLLSQIAVPVV
jgi:hypothetical protein